MRLFAPDYFDRFQCIASRCPDSCCKEWAVDIDDSTAAFYRSLSGDLGDRLRQALQDTDDGTVMTIVDGRCPMWQQDGLCRIHAELGHEALCRICRDFPRIRHEFEDFTELGLELSCPEAARLILTTSWAMPLPQDSCDPELLLLLKSRQAALALLEDEQYSLPEALAIILVYAHHVQAALDGEALPPLQPQLYLETAGKLQKSGDLLAIFSFFGQLEILTDQWRTRLSAGPQSVCRWEHLRPLARYMILRYWLQSVSDLDLIPRVKLAVIACLMVGSLGGDTVETAQLFSKEIENDPDNIAAILDACYTCTALTDQNLFSILLP